MSSFLQPAPQDQGYSVLNLIDELCRWLCRLIYNNLYFVFSVPIVFLLLLIPQIYTVISETVEVPPTDSDFGQRLAVLFLGFLLTVGAFCLASVFAVVPPHWTPPRSPMLGQLCAWLVAKWNSGVDALSRRPSLAGAWPSVASWSFTVLGLFLWLFVIVGPHLKVWMRWSSLPVLMFTALFLPGMAAALIRRLGMRRASARTERLQARAQWAEWQLRLRQGIFWLLGGLFWLCLFIWVVPRNEEWLAWSLPMAVIYLAVPMAFLVKPVAGWLILFTWFGRQWQLLFGAILLTASVLIFFKGAEAIASGSYLLAGGICRQFGALFGFTGAWFILRTIPWDRGSNMPYLVAPGRVLGWLFLASILGECIWVAAARQTDWLGASYRLYTIWGVLQTATLVVVLSAMIDAWQRENHWAMRVLTLVALMMAFTFFWATPELLTTSIEGFEQAGLSSTPRPKDDAERWYNHMIKRLESLDEKEPAVFVAASGGGSRASIFTALVLEDLARRQLGDKGKSWADHIVLISSVSGGSLANAYYVHAATAVAPSSSGLRERDDLRNSVKGELIYRMIKKAEEREGQTKAILLDMLGLESADAMRCDDDHLHALYAELVKCRTQWEKENAEVDDSKSCPGIAQSCPGIAQPRTVQEWNDLSTAFDVWLFCKNYPSNNPDLRRDWVLCSAFVDAMCTDFMAPVIRGTLTPQISRGRSLRHFWTYEFGWHHSGSRAGYDYHDESQAGGPDEAARFLFDPVRHPLALFNTCDARTGTRVVAGFPPLPSELLKASYHHGDRRVPRTLEEFDPARTTSLADAVGMSANFPFGFNVIRLDTNGRTDDSSANPEPPSLHLVDGGVVDNTGIDTVFEVLRNVQKISTYSDDHPGPSGSGHDPLAIAKCRRIVELLQTRRVVLLEIDSGAKPGKPGLFERYASVLFEPLAAMNNAGYTNADLARKNYNDALDRQFRLKPNLDTAEQKLRQGPSGEITQGLLGEIEKIEQQGIPTYFHITYICNHLDEDNVLTAWSLGPNEKALLLLRFQLEHESCLNEFKKFDSTNAVSVQEELKSLNDNADNVIDEYLRNFPRYKQLTNQLETLIEARRQVFKQAAELAKRSVDETALKELLRNVDHQMQSQAAFREQASWLLELSPEFQTTLNASDHELDAFHLAVTAPLSPERAKDLGRFANEETKLAAAKESVMTLWMKLLHRKLPAKGSQKLFDQRTQSTRRYFEAKPPSKR
jgi:hypothetical protein